MFRMSTLPRCSQSPNLPSKDDSNFFVASVPNGQKNRIMSALMRKTTHQQRKTMQVHTRMSRYPGEDNWERSDYPFVALEGNRAACAICLLDFEEPKRKHPLPAENETKPEEAEEATPAEPENVASGSNSPTHPTNIAEEHRPEALKLEDAGEGAQPLRLLECGHVFHKTCLDPWLIDVSGRCPICQRAVEVPKPAKKSRRRAT